MPQWPEISPLQFESPSQYFFLSASSLVIPLPLICIRNLSRKTGLMNGTRGVIRRLLKHSVAVKVACGPSAGGTIFVPRINLQSTGQAKGFFPKDCPNYNGGGGEKTIVNLKNDSLGLTGDMAIRFTRRQFPLKLAWAMTINKSQGQSLERVGVMLPARIW